MGLDFPSEHQHYSKGSFFKLKQSGAAVCGVPPSKPSRRRSFLGNSTSGACSGENGEGTDTTLSPSASFTSAQSCSDDTAPLIAPPITLRGILKKNISDSSWASKSTTNSNPRSRTRRRRRSSSSSRCRVISFSVVQVQEYELCLGVHPCCEDFPLSLGWAHTEMKEYKVSQYNKSFTDIDLHRRRPPSTFHMETAQRWVRLATVSGQNVIEVAAMEQKRKERLTRESELDKLRDRLRQQVEDYRKKKEERIVLQVMHKGDKTPRHPIPVIPIDKRAEQDFIDADDGSDLWSDEEDMHDLDDISWNDYDSDDETSTILSPTRDARDDDDDSSTILSLSDVDDDDIDDALSVFTKDDLNFLTAAHQTKATKPMVYATTLAVHAASAIYQPYYFL